MVGKPRGRWTKKRTEQAIITGEFSFYFDVVGEYWARGANEERAAPLNRICTQARKMGVKAVVVEDALERDEIRREIDALRKKLPTTSGTVTAAAISFLRFLPVEGQTEGNAEHMIGQVVVITYPGRGGPTSYVFEALMRVPARWEVDREVPLVNRCVPKAQSFERSALGCKYVIAGAYYCQENGVTRDNVQSALRIAIRSIEGTSSIHDDRLSKARTLKGTADLIVKTLRNKKYGYSLYEIGERTNADDVWTVMCSFIESGNPPLLVLSGRGQADRIIPVLGYALNTDEWHPGGGMLHASRKSGWFSSSQWIDHVVVHDALLGPYFCLSRAWLSETIGRARKRGMRPRLVIAPIWTPDVKVSPVFAEQLAGQYLNVWIKHISQASAGSGRWWDYLLENGRYIVLRTTFISAHDYHSHLQKLDDNLQECTPSPTWMTPRQSGSRSFDSFISSLPKNFWICEISLPQLYVGNRRKLGEILIDSSKHDISTGFLGMRLPSRAVWRNGSGSFLLAPTGMDAHGELLQANALTVS